MNIPQRARELTEKINRMRDHAMIHEFEAELTAFAAEVERDALERANARVAELEAERATINLRPVSDGTVKIPDFGIDRIEWRGTYLECRRVAPGVTMQNLLNAYSAATENCTMADSLSGNPSKWPISRGVKAVLDLILDAVYDDSAPLARAIAASNARVAELLSLINTPQTNEWFEAVGFEAAHQIERWGSAHDVGKTPMDWFWLIGFLAQKAAMAEIQGDIEKAKHHTISTGAAMLNWFRALAGESNTMRPGVEGPVEVNTHDAP